MKRLERVFPLSSFHSTTTASTRPRFPSGIEDQADKPIAAPTPDYDPIGEYIVSFHKLLERFTSAESNVRLIRAET